MEMMIFIAVNTQSMVGVHESTDNKSIKYNEASIYRRRQLNVDVAPSRCLVYRSALNERYLGEKTINENRILSIKDEEMEREHKME
jgi:hypothetical protein